LHKTMTDASTINRISRWVLITGYCAVLLVYIGGAVEQLFESKIVLSDRYWIVPNWLRRRSGFGSETSYSMAETGTTITGTRQGTFTWSVYSRAVRFPDGILLVRKGAVRWLPDAALKSGAVEEAMALVSSQLPTRTITR
jgi:hypothetical protein